MSWLREALEGLPPRDLRALRRRTRRATGGCGPGSALGRFTDADPASPGARSLSATRLAQDAQDPVPVVPALLQRLL